MDVSGVAWVLVAATAIVASVLLAILCLNCGNRGPLGGTSSYVLHVVTKRCSSQSERVALMLVILPKNIPGFQWFCKNVALIRMEKPQKLNLDQQTNNNKGLQSQ